MNDINEDKFVPKQFSSNKTKKVPENIVIDLQKNTIKVPEIEQVEPDSIFHHSVSYTILFVTILKCVLIFHWLSC